MGDNYDKSDSMWEKTEEEERNINEKGDIHSFVCVQMVQTELTGDCGDTFETSTGIF